MNAAPPVLQAQSLREAVQPDAQAVAASATSRTGSRDFAAALSDAGAKPARKSATRKQQNPAQSGSSLPASGIQPPPAPVWPPPAKTDISVPGKPGVAGVAGVARPTGAGTVANGPSIATASPTRAPASAGANAAAAAVGANANGAATTILNSASLVQAPAPAPTPAAAVLPGVTDSAGTAAAPTPATGVDATTTTAPASGLSMPHAAGSGTPATPGPSAAAVPSLPALKPGSPQLSDVGATSRPIASGDAAPSSADAGALNDSTLSGGPAASGTDAAAQAAMAAAIAQGTSAPAPQTSASDDLAVPDTGVSPGVVSPSDAAAAAPAAALARATAAAMSAAMTAATAASVQAVSDAAGAGTADKRSHASGPDATLAGATNDGSAGAAQLLTSNTSSDTPTPTFKVAAGVDTAQFGQGVADRVGLMMDGNLTSAKLQVNPPALGPIEVRIALQGGHAQVWLSSHSALTRDALESSSTKLREMLGSQGFSQVSVDISQRSFQERSPPSQAYEAAPPISDVRALAHAPVSMSRSASGLLDAYA